MHAGRIERGKADTTVYGISTDSVTFNFYRINERSKVSQTTLRYISLQLYSDILKVVFEDPDLGIHQRRESHDSLPPPHAHLLGVYTIPSTYP